MGRSSNQHIALSITDGRTVRDLFHNGLLDYLQDMGFSVTVFTEATTVPSFIREWQRAKVDFARLYPVTMSRARYHSLKLRRKLMQWHADALLGEYMRIERRSLYCPHQDYVEYFQQKRPSLLLATHIHLLQEFELINAAKFLGISTLGIVRSWDNVYKGLQSRTDHVAVWNDINRNEVIEFDRYRPRDVTTIGVPQFDPYFASDVLWPRQKLAAQFNLDPARPIILFATMGYFIPGFDETCWMDVLLELIDQGIIPGRPQVICRLHPWSRLEHFQQYTRHQDVRLSYVDRYKPVLTWYMTREDVGLVANMLQHADVVITPGTTITVEAAIFDTPTLVPVFHPYQPELASSYFASVMLSKHFRRLERLNLVPIIRNAEDSRPCRKPMPDESKLV